MCRIAVTQLRIYSIEVPASCELCAIPQQKGVVSRGCQTECTVAAVIVVRPILITAHFTDRQTRMHMCTTVSLSLFLYFSASLCVVEYIMYSCMCSFFSSSSNANEMETTHTLTLRWPLCVLNLVWISSYIIFWLKTQSIPNISNGHCICMLPYSSSRPLVALSLHFSNVSYPFEHFVS